jgi:hypothetical protein
MLKRITSRPATPLSLVFILGLALCGGSLLPAPLSAETPEEKAQREADKKAAEAKKKLEEMNKKAKESVQYKFDRFKNATLIFTREEKVRSQSEVFAMKGDLFMQPSTTVEGEAKKDTNPLTRPETVSLFFFATADNRASLLYGNSQELLFLVDGKAMGPYPVKYDSGKTSDGKDWYENMDTELPYADFYKIAAAQKVEGRMGTMEFKFNDYQRILYRTFLIAISPAKAK